jgi:hypothetical protein
VKVEDFIENVKAVDKDYAVLLRQIYIESFVDTAKDHYKDFILKKTTYIDGDFYQGYLWEYFFKAKQISRFFLTNTLIEKEKVYVMWDVHSCERINVAAYNKSGNKRYWLFDRDDVLQTVPSNLLEGLNFLPEDIYIFDDTFEWSLCLTHETDLKNRDFLLCAEPRKDLALVY